MKRLNELLKKYDVPVPRYTSYPTVPCWDQDHFSVSSWRHAIEKTFDESNDSKGISLYIHLPFCESLCTYCACNTRITKNHNVEDTYLQAVLTEWELYRYIFGKRPVIREIHLGGGTPTFFSPDNLKRLLHKILNNSTVHPDHEFSFEGHPNNTTKDHLQTLYDLDFRRVSYGIQDLDTTVQQAIHRIQPFENVRNVVEISREIGYESISFDLIYGLPYQTTKSIASTFIKTLELKPDRIAFYSYAHVPWIKPGQRCYEDANLPNDVVKRSLYETGRQLLLDNGYHDIGMDHFSLPHDALFVAKENNLLHRNFMGYTTSQTDLLIGLGASAISDAKYAYAQNIKGVEEYQNTIANHKLAILKGHIQTGEDLHIKKCILDIACKGFLKKEHLMGVWDEDVTTRLKVMQQEGIVKFTSEGMEVTEMGSAFIRNICHVFDLRLMALNPDREKVFSKAI